ncbi:alpha/beta hydrolase-fold protein [Alteromonas sp. ASW11-19]|uniref:Alpha/beta hydrolase-fold protein n=1 Tax=Alteromonas salexigens TaxID=2982530 RepID=A0ABT2VLQ9_9ALTE|nr:alpha/beta hydrolase-fold protein [Alteromonas salexigens]MCU7554245.1 alpha/beta hydrolase-fold protein [Alteromonas salexigens]
MSSKLYVAVALAGVLMGCSEQKPGTSQQSSSTVDPPSAQTTADNSVSEHVTVLPEAVQYPDGSDRRIWVYLPPDYTTSSSRYPVVYMHDGQNVFSKETSYAGEWQVDETLDALHAEGVGVPIVVAVDHGGDKRMQELSPWTNSRFGDASGDTYLQFITETVKPYVDSHYRTRPAAAHTGIMGSSMGGLMSHYAIVARPDIFSRAAVFSPSYWYSQSSFEFAEAHPLPDSHRVYMNVGEKEGSQMVDGMQAMASLHLAQQHPDEALRATVIAGAEHNEAFWRGQVTPALAFLGFLTNFDNKAEQHHE